MVPLLVDYTVCADTVGENWGVLCQTFQSASLPHPSNDVSLLSLYPQSHLITYHSCLPTVCVRDRQRTGSNVNSRQNLIEFYWGDILWSTMLEGSSVNYINLSLNEDSVSKWETTLQGVHMGKIPLIIDERHKIFINVKKVGFLSHT
jgi:hypothetical protein